MAAIERLQSLWSRLNGFWEQLKPQDCVRWSCPHFHDLDRLSTEVRESVCDSYPPNHNFTILGDKLVPSRKLASRLAHFRPYYRTPLVNLLDLSCSKGFFLFDAASDDSCQLALGIDLCPKTLDICRALRSHFHHPGRIGVEQLTLAELAGRVEEFGGPFENVLLVNTYQYLFFGSSIAPALSHDHHEIFRFLRRVCCGRVIFHNRISFSRVQKHIRDSLPAGDWTQLYSPQAIRSAASQYFQITETPVWGGHPVWILDVK
jgi:hypothetical protein